MFAYHTGSGRRPHEWVWETITSPVGGAVGVTGIAESPDCLIMAGWPASTNVFLLRSTDNGASWVDVSPGTNMYAAGVAYSPSRDEFVCPGFRLGGSFNIIVSTDKGLTWSEYDESAFQTYSPQDVVWSPDDNLYVVCCNQDGVGTSGRIYTSPDGITWTSRTIPKNFELYCITWGNGLFVAAGISDGSDTYIITSPDGINWTERVAPRTTSVWGAGYGNGTYILVGGVVGGDAYLLTSPDGTNWTERPNPKAFALTDVAYGKNSFIAVGDNDGVDTYVVESYDNGATWVERTTDATRHLYAVKWATTNWVAGGAPILSTGQYIGKA